MKVGIVGAGMVGSSAAYALTIDLQGMVPWGEWPMQRATSPVQVPHEALALVVDRTRSSVLAPARMASTILPLHTPLQPQISALGGKAATAAKGSAWAPP